MRFSIGFLTLLLTISSLPYLSLSQPHLRPPPPPDHGPMKPRERLRLAAKEGDYINNNFNHDRHYSKTGNRNIDGDDDGYGSYIPIMTIVERGTWWSGNDHGSKEFDFFENNEGFALYQALDSGKNLDDNVTFMFYDGPFRDQKAVIVNFVYENSTDFDPKNSTFKNSDITFRLTMIDNYKVLGQKNCHGSYQLSFINTHKGNIPYQKHLRDYFGAAANFWLNSTDCKISISSFVEVHNAVEDKKAIYYVMMVTLVCLAHLYGCVQVIRHISINENDGTRYSIATIVMITSWDVFVCFFHFYQALIVKTSFQYFITPAFWFFILSSILEARLLLIIWKSNYYNNYQNMDEVRNALARFYGRFYSYLIPFLIATCIFAPSSWFFYISALFFVPQIIHNIKRGGKYRFDSSYVFLLGAARMAIPLYIKSYNGSMFRYTTSLSFLFLYPAIILSQVLILYLQSKLGSRFIVPSMFLPPTYDYYVKCTKNTITDEGIDETCSICMDNLLQETVDAKNEGNTSLLATKTANNEKIMKTPCRHHFHESCLKGWMEIKLECPFCRSPLPPLE